MWFSGIPAAITPEVFAMTIPLLSIMGGVLIAITAIIMSGRKKELKHKERITAMEKGIELPSESPKPVPKPKFQGTRRGGLVMTLIGLSLTIAIWTVAGADGGVWGLIPLAIGVGLLIAGNLERKEYERERSLQEREDDQ